MGIKLDDAVYERVKQTACRLKRTPQWLINQAILHYLDILEKDITPSLQLPAVSMHNDIPKMNNESCKPFSNLAKQILPQSIVRAAITVAWRRPETELIPQLLEQASYPVTMAETIQKLAGKLVNKLRHKHYSNSRTSIVQDLLQEFSLSSKEGIALMCLAEALLRIPDPATQNELIKDKIINNNWQTHLGKSQSIFVNAVTWSLLLTGKILVSYNNDDFLSKSLNRILSKGGEPIIRKSMNVAMRLMGEQFVTGEHIAEALHNSKRLNQQGFRYSYDMLGEAALTEEDAQTYLLSYQEAIHAIGKSSSSQGIYEGPGISIKLSALHPRYCRAQYKRVMTELYPRLLHLTSLAKQYDIGLNIDAEESDRLEISLDLLTKLCLEPSLAGWNGIGFVIQAYQKRCLQVIDELVDLAKLSQRRLMVRLVKGAYWDNEIKRTQVEGLEDYPVFTRKVYTDLSYLACARKLLSITNYVYPQFATHNAHTLAAIYYLAGQNYYSGQYEFQCLHGMGELLYEQVVGKISEGKLNRPCRIYAPVGSYKTLLAYLVRRLLENGANTSFVNRIADHSIPLEQLIADPIQEVTQLGIYEGRLGVSHPSIPLPRNLYGAKRINSSGLDLANEHHLSSLSSALLSTEHQYLQAAPIVINKIGNGIIQKISNPADHRDLVGECQHSSFDEVKQALDVAVHYESRWSLTPPVDRAAILKEAANKIEKDMRSFIGLLVREAGKSFTNAISEVRETIDFLRYYACQIEQNFDINNYRPLGTVVCISPWNFPLAIFIGQIAAALAAGNTVLAKPAEQTPLIANKAVLLMLEAGVPLGVLQLLPGSGETIGEALVSDQRVRGVIFTGSTQVAKLIQNTLVKRLNTHSQSISFIAETGGINAMLVDSSALTEQVVIDIINSAFDSSGQRCSALRLLCIQEEVAERTLRMLRGAMAEYTLGNPELLNTDIGPVIDANAKALIDNYIISMRERGHNIWQTIIPNTIDNINGTFIPLTLIELDSVSSLTQEIFGPVLHVVRYHRHELDSIIDQINEMGYGLTFGLHTRIDETIQRIIKKVHVGNVYVNRNIVGAVVGVQPFGGEGLSGTGPKAGGPLYLYRLLSKRRHDVILPSLQILDSVQTPDFTQREILQTAHFSLVHWMETNHPTMASFCRFIGKISQAGSIRTLTGPTGEHNSYRLLPREYILCFADNNIDLLNQLSVITSIGAKALWIDSPQSQQLFTKLPNIVRKCITILEDWTQENIKIDAILFHGDCNQLCDLAQIIVKRPGPLVNIQFYARGDNKIILEQLLIERTVSINTTAAGGNASLMTLG